MATDAPTGWMWVTDTTMEDGGYFRPDPRHSLHPYNVKMGQTPKLREWLDEDPELQTFIHEKRPGWRSVFATFDTIPMVGRIDHRYVAEVRAFTAQVTGEMDAASRKLGPRDVPEWVKFHYLATHLIPARYQATVWTTVEPLGLRAQRDGTIGMHFTGATQTERWAYEGLIREAQAFFGHRRDRGGRKSRKKDPDKAKDVKTAAKLHHWLGWSHAAIAALLGWGETRNTIDERVRRNIRDGEDLLAIELGPEWHVEPPAVLEDRT